MKNYKITKKLFNLTLLLLIINALVFLYDGGIGLSMLAGGVVFYFPLVLLAIMFDRFYLKNKGYQFFAIIAFMCVSAYIIYFFIQNYFSDHSF